MRIDCSSFRLTIGWLAILLLFPVIVSAQDSKISGKVTDSSGGVIPGVEVTVTNLETGVSRHVITNDSGRYSVPQLFGGHYRVTASMAGFDTQQLELLLDPVQATEQNFRLSVGAPTNVVEVLSTAARIDFNPYDVATVIEEKQIEQLPLDGRNVLALAALSPGVLRGSQGGRGYNAEEGFRSGGLAMEHVAISLDGVDNAGRSVFGPLRTQSMTAKPPPEAIAEFKVITNNTSAEYGNKAAATVLISTKGGTNEFHGGVYEFHRNAAQAANNFMFNRDGPRDANGNLTENPPPYIRNQFGGTFGGPVIKDKTFFFFSYQGTRLVESGNAFLRRVPTALERQGDFSQSDCGQVGRCPDIFDPLTLSGTGAEAERQPFPNNALPSNRIDPAAQAVLNLYPLPNVSGIEQSNYFYVQKNNTESDLYDIRIDHNFSDRHRIFGRYSYRNEDRLRGAPNSLPFPARSRDIDEFRTKQFAVNYNATLTSKIHNEFRGGFSKFPASRTDERTENENAKYGIPNAAVEQHPEFAKDPKHQVGLVIFAPTGYDQVGGGSQGGTSVGLLDTVTIADNLLWDVGKHSLKFGAEYRRWDNLRSHLFTNDMGRMDFDGRYTAQFPNDPVSRGATGNAIADNLLGFPWRTINNLPNGEDMNIPYWGFYVQDDFRITPRLTLNLGLRYELFMQPRINLGSGLQNARPVWHGTLDEESRYIDVVFDRWDLPKSSSDCGCKLDTNDWAPRLGMAYRVTQNTVFRAGAGLYYSENSAAGIESSRYNSNGPVQFNNTVNSNSLPGGYEFPDTTVSEGFQLYEINTDVPLDVFAFPRMGGELGANVPYFKKTINVYQWFADLQHQFPGDILVTLGYNGISAHNMPLWNRDFGAGLGPSTLPAGHPSRIRLLGPEETNTAVQLQNYVITGDNMMNANYNAFTFKAEKRFSDGLSFTSSFTWSKGIDYGTTSEVEAIEGKFGGGQPLSPYAKDLWRNRGPSGLSRDFAYNLSVLYELPAGPGKGHFQSGPASWILGGWQVGTILSLQSGPWATHRWAPNTQNTNTGFNAPDRGDLVGDPNLPESERDSTRWYDQSAFAAGTPGEWHNAGKGIIELPGWKNVDLLLSKYFQMPWEGHRLQFRFEAFNLTNTPHLGGPGATNPVVGFNVNSTNGARIFLADLPRIIQFALKYNF